MADQVTPTKPGVKTTEFYVNIGIQIIGVIVAMGWVTPEQSDTLTKALVQLGGVVGMLVSQFGYLWSRTKVKEAEAAKNTTP